MSAREFFWTWNYSASKGATLLVQLVVASYADQHGVSWPSLDLIAKEARISPRTVTRALQELPKNEVVYFEKSAGAYDRARSSAQSHLFIFLGNRDPVYSQTIRDLWVELKPYTPIYGGTVDNKIGIDILTTLLKTIRDKGALVPDKSSQPVQTGDANLSQGIDKVTKGIDKVADDSFKESFKESFKDDMVFLASQIFSSSLDQARFIKAVRSWSFVDGTFSIGIDPNQPGLRTWIQNSLNNKAGINTLEALLIKNEKITEVNVL